MIAEADFDYPRNLIIESNYQVDWPPTTLKSLPYSQGYLYGRRGRREEAIRVARELQTLVEEGQTSEDHVAYVYAGMGDLDAFFKWMNIAMEKRHVESFVLKNYLRPMAPEITADPRWKDLQKKGGLA